MRIKNANTRKKQIVKSVHKKCKKLKKIYKMYNNKKCQYQWMSGF